MDEEWTQTVLGDIAEVGMGRQRAPRYASGDDLVPYLRAANVKDGRLDLSSVLSMNFDLAEQSTYSLKLGDVLVSEGSGSIAAVGASAQWRGEIPGTVCYQNTLLRLRAVHGVSTADFLSTWASEAYSSGAFASAASGTNIFHVGLSRARALPVLLPPIADQRRVADLVGACEDAVKHAAGLSDSARRARMAVLEDYLSRAAPEGWPMVRFDELADLRLGFTKGQRSGALQQVPYLRAANLTFGELRLDDVASIEIEAAEVERHAICVGDVLMTEGGNPWDLGRGWIWEGQLSVCAHQNSVIRATGFREDVAPRFVAYLLESQALRAHFESRSAQTSGVAHLGKRGAAEALLPLPDAATQARIVATLDALRETEIAARDEGAALKRLRKTLRTGLLHGKIQIAPSYDRFLDGDG